MRSSIVVVVVVAIIIIIFISLPSSTTPILTPELNFPPFDLNDAVELRILRSVQRSALGAA